MARRTLPEDGVPERLGTAGADCKVKSRAPSPPLLAPTPETRGGRGTPGSSRDSLLLELEESGFDLGLGVF